MSRVTCVSLQTLYEEYRIVYVMQVYIYYILPVKLPELFDI